MIGRTTAIQGMMQRSDESALIRKNEENRPLVNQSNAQKLNEKEVQEKYENVVKKDNADYNNEKYDAKEKGKGEYLLLKKKKKQKKDEEDGVVRIKHSGGFDVKI